MKKASTAFPVKETSLALDAWFREHGRDYPWRRTTDAYAILVSEMMLQQTQISTVLDRGYYARWMASFPDVQSLAKAEESEVLRTWEGLGYYRRARFLHQMAKVVVAEHGGQFPKDAEGLRSLPGIGAYTVGAVLSFSHDLPAPLVDGNVARVLARLYNDPTPVDSTLGISRLWQRAEALVACAISPRVHNSAIMELGQRICRFSQPDCGNCPVQTWCLAEDPASLPVKGKRTTITEVTERVCFDQNADGVLLERETGKRRTGLWKLPGLGEATPLPPVLHKARYTITRYRVTLWVHAAGEMADVTLRRIPLAELADLPMPSPYRKALNTLLSTTEFRLNN